MIFRDPIKQYRFFEMIPGILVWSTFILALVLSAFKPVWIIAFVIAYSFLWLLRVIYFVIFIVIGWKRYNNAIDTNWSDKISEDLYHLIVMPTYKEPFEVIKNSIDSYLEADYDSKKMIVVLSGEERAGIDHANNIADRINKEYQGKFLKLVTTVHPDGIMGEMKGKGANSHWAAHKAKETIDELGIDYEKIVVSYFDVDTVVHPQYFSHLTYQYKNHPKPNQTAYQPLVLFNNNIWEAPLIARIAAFNTTFWLMTDLARPDRLFTFSSHAMGFKALLEIGFWQRDIVTDDSRIFLQGFVKYKGDFKTTPMYVPVYMDSVQAETYTGAFKNLYKQQRRWAYGVENFPYMVWHFFKRDHGIPFMKKIKYLWNLGEGLYSWSTVPIMLLLLGRLPFWLATDEVQRTFLAQFAPFVLQVILGLSMVGIFISAMFSILMLPPRPDGQPRHKVALMLFQWALLPITIVVWGAIPATDAQTRLMLGKYLGFWVTDKVRK